VGPVRLDVPGGGVKTHHSLPPTEDNITHSVAHATEGVGPVRLDVPGGGVRTHHSLPPSEFNITRSVAHAAEGVGTLRSPATLAQTGYDNAQSGAGEAGGLCLHVTPGDGSGPVDATTALENGAETSVDTSVRLEGPGGGVKTHHSLPPTEDNITHSVAHAAEGVGPVRSPAMLAQAGYENSQPGAGEAGGLFLQVTPGGCSGLVDTSLTLVNGAEASVDTS
jgi:hypothetical protein